jgi:hypothetical protein
MAKPLKVGIRAGGTPNSEYKWDVHFLDVAGGEARKLLTDWQYEHLKDAVKALASEQDPKRSQCEDVSAVEDYFELKLKGGPLGKINLRAFFVVLEEPKTILYLHVWKKEAEHQTPSQVKRLVRSRLRKFEAGEYGELG